MLPRIIFCAAVSAAILAVVLLALVSPTAHKNPSSQKAMLSLSMYVQKLAPPSSLSAAVGPPPGAAVIFYHALTEGPGEETPVVGVAQGFIIPSEKFARSAFNVIYFSLRTREFSGSVGVEGRRLREEEREELRVLGGTGSFAFARGHAVLTRISRLRAGGAALYHVKLHLLLPDICHRPFPVD